MPPHYRVHWDKARQSWRSDCGEEVIGKDGRARRRPVFFRGIPKDDHPAAAQALLDYLKAEDARSYNPGDPTVEAVAELYLAHSEKVSKPRTVTGHAEMLRALCDWPSTTDPNRLGLRRARTVGAIELRKMLAEWERRDYSPHYRARLVRSVKACWAWASSPDPERMPERLVPEHTMLSVKEPAIPHAPERYAERSEVAAFLRFARTRANASPNLYRRFARKLLLLIRVAAHTGCRPSEACMAEWVEFDAGKGTISLPAAKTKTGHRTGRGRVLFLPPVLVRALSRELARADRHPTHLFSHKRGKGGKDRGAGRATGEPWDGKALAKAVCKLRDAAIVAGVPLERTGDNRFVMYRLRHTKASDDLMAGGNPVTVAELLGTSPRMLQTTYGHLLQDHLSDAAKDLHGKRRRGSSEE